MMLSQNKGQWMQTAAQENPSEHEEKLYCEGDSSGSLPTEAVEGLSLETVKTHQDIILSNLL